jgi:hypothetical protein
MAHTPERGFETLEEELAFELMIFEVYLKAANIEPIKVNTIMRMVQEDIVTIAKMVGHYEG